MKPIINLEFTARAAEHEFKQESVAFQSPRELFEFVSPGGGCEHIPDGVDEIQIVFLPPAEPNIKNPMNDVPATLELGIVFFTGPLTEIVQTTQQLLGKASRGELSESFLSIIGMKS